MTRPLLVILMGDRRACNDTRRALKARYRFLELGDEAGGIDIDGARFVHIETDVDHAFELAAEWDQEGSTSLRFVLMSRTKRDRPRKSAAIEDAVLARKATPGFMFLPRARLPTTLRTILTVIEDVMIREEV